MIRVEGLEVVVGAGVRLVCFDLFWFVLHHLAVIVKIYAGRSKPELHLQDTGCNQA